MAQFDATTLAIVKRLQNARLSLLQKHPFYALLLMHMKFSLDLTCETAYTDGDRIAFNPDFINDLSDSELEFVLMHEVLHTALGHPFRHQQDYDQQAFDIACDIVVNSNILYSFGMDRRRITLGKYGEAMHIAPDGKEGYEYTVEQVYELVCKALNKPLRKQKPQPGQVNGKGKGDGDGEGKRKDKGDGKGKGQEQSQGSGGSSNPDDPSEEDMQKLIASLLQRSTGDSGATQSLQKEMTMGQPGTMEACQNKPLDDHTFWEGDDEITGQQDVWLQRMVNATDVVSSTDFVMRKEKSHKGFGGPPLCAQRVVEGLRNPEVDWRTLLHTFVQEEITDYSFSPPDKRMQDSPFFLPDFNEKEESVKNVWFLIDTSGSIGDDALSAAYSEIVSAIEIFDHHLEGLLSFTEVFVTDPIPFCSEEELLEIKPVGGGGNDFGEIFRYMQRNMMDNLPVSIVILTDGYDNYPPEEEALGVPVLWLINNEDAQEPPWGKWARFRIGETDKKKPLTKRAR